MLVEFYGDSPLKINHSMKIEWLLITFSLMVLSCSSTEVGEGGNVRIAIDSYSSAEGNDTNAFDFNVRLSETTASSVYPNTPFIAPSEAALNTFLISS